MFTARRKPKRVVTDESRSQDAELDETGPVVRRPEVIKSKSRLRVSYEPGETIAASEPRFRSTRLGPSSASSSLPRFSEDRQDESRPSYSKTTLDELRNSTPSTPRELQIVGASHESTLDVAAKFGASSIAPANVIPSAAEIKEKKERRARLAKEQGAEDFIPLEDYDSDGEFKPQRMQVGSYLTRNVEKDTRLVRDDEDFGEGFDEFVEDAGTVVGGSKRMLQQARKDREALREMIDHAEGSADDDSDSEVERNYAYESAQTRHGMEGIRDHSQHKREINRPRPPKETTQIPKLGIALSRLKDALQHMELEKIKITRRQASVKTERADIRASQDHIQRSLEEAGQELARLQETETQSIEPSLANRGLDSMGNA